MLRILDEEVFPVSGFLAPVDAPPVVNSVKAGAAVPVKFSLGGDHASRSLLPAIPAHS